MQLVGLETINPGECAVFAGGVEATDLTDADLMLILGRLYMARWRSPAYRSGLENRRA